MKSWPYQTKMNRNPDVIDVLEHNHTMLSWILIRNYEFEPWNNKKSFDFHLEKYDSGTEMILYTVYNIPDALHFNVFYVYSSLGSQWSSFDMLNVSSALNKTGTIYVGPLLLRPRPNMFARLSSNFGEMVIFNDTDRLTVSMWMVLVQSKLNYSDNWTSGKRI